MYRQQKVGAPFKPYFGLSGIHGTRPVEVSILLAIHWTAILPRCYRSFGVRSRQRPPLNLLLITPEVFDGNHPR